MQTLKQIINMLNENKSICCHDCGHKHPMDTPCPSPKLTGDRSCARRKNELHTIDHDGHDEHQQMHADVEEVFDFCPECLMEYIEEHWNTLEEAEYRGRKVSLGKPFLTPGGPKKRAVYVKNAKGNVVKVNFGDPNLKIKKNIPARRKAFRARHKCATAKDRTSPRYWSCKHW